MTSKGFPRAKRIAQQIQQTLSELIRREVRDPRLGMVTLTEVRVAPDLGSAKVYFSVLGASPQQAQEILEAAAPMLRGPLGRALALRHAPKLEFVYDQQIEHADKLTQLIDRAVKSDENKQ